MVVKKIAKSIVNGREEKVEEFSMAVKKIQSFQVSR